MSAAHRNLWEDTAVAAPDVPRLEAGTRADVLIVGAGYLGLSAALHLAEAGVDAVVLDAHVPGWGASGRNGGQLIPGLKYGPEELEHKFGRERGERLWRFAGSVADFVLELAQKHAMAAEARRTAWLQGAHSDAALDKAKARAEAWATRGADVGMLGAADTEAISGVGIYRGALIDRRAGSVQPLSYARELARAALAAGARIHRDATVTDLVRREGRWHASTGHGPTVEADTVLVCTNAYSGGAVVGLPQSIVAATSLQIATAPLPDAARRRILPGGEVLSDTQRLIRYWRLDRDGRLLLGARGPYREPGPAGDWAHLRHDLAKLFPYLGDVEVTHRWGGRVAVHPDFLPKLHAPAPGMFVEIGCQGRGVGWQSAMGAELARLVTEAGHDPVLPLSPIRPIPAHRLKAVTVPAVTTLYRVLDRLGFA